MSIIDTAVTRALVSELTQEPDPEQALRKALLGVILLTQGEVSDDVAPLFDYLLLEFLPLSQAFDNHRQPFLGQEFITRLQLVDHVEVALREEFVRQLVSAIGDEP